MTCLTLFNGNPRTRVVTDDTFCDLVIGFQGKSGLVFLVNCLVININPFFLLTCLKQNIKMTSLGSDL